MFAEPFLDRRYDAILCHFGGNGMDIVCLRDAFPHTRFVTMFHGDDNFIGDEKDPEAFALLKRFGDAFLVGTDCFGRVTLRRYGFEDRHIVTLRLSIAARKIPFRERRRTGNSVRLLSVDRLVEKKGLQFGVLAAAAYQAANPGLRLEYRIIGDGPLRSDLSRLAEQLGAAATVQLLGVLQGAGDVQATTDALQELLACSDQWPAMGQEGRRHVEEHFDVDGLTSQLEEVHQARP